jgi:NodT family efflux transporter outer membrane factor (OMF) lipoprotein
MRIALPIMLTLALVGCQKQPVQVRHKPDLEAPTEWTAAEVSETGVTTRWWSTFSDPMLADLVKDGLEKNYNLQAAAARVEAAAAQARIAGADQLPTLSAGWNGRGQRQNFIGLPIPGSEGRVLSRTYKTSGVSLDVSWEADVWGRISAGKRAAIADLAASEADLRGARLSLAGQISKAWFGLLEGLAQVRLAERTVESYRETSQRVRARYVSGLQSSLDLRLALSSLASAEALLEQRKRQLDAGVRQLEILLGEYPDAELEVSRPLPDIPETPPVGIPSDLVARRPDLVSAEQRMWAAGARWSQARRSLYPKFSISGGIGTSSGDFLQIANGDFFVWNMAGNILQPIFQGGRIRAQIRLEDARSKEAAAQWASLVLEAFSEVETALVSERYLAEQEGSLRTASAQATASLKLAEDRYNSGLENFVTVLEAQRRSLDAESQLLSVRRQRLDARIDLHLALGGGLDEQSADAPPGIDVRKEGDS